MTLQDFLKKYLGKIKGYPDDNSYKGECLSIVKLYIKEVFNISPPASGSGSAYGYWSNFPNPLGEVFEKVENTPDLIPQEGWIAIWKPWSNNQYGHIAIVAKGSTTGTLKNYAQNWTSRTFQLESNRYTNVIGFLKPSGIIEDMTEGEKRMLEIIKQASLDEGDIRWLSDNIDIKDDDVVGGFKKTISDLYTDLEKKSQEYNKLLEDYNILLPKYEESQKVIQDCQTSTSSANLSIRELLILLINKIFKK
jgi:surface antigen